MYIGIIQNIIETGICFRMYRSEPIETDEYFLTVLRYIHQNPIKAKLVDNIADNIIRITFKATPQQGCAFSKGNLL